ncbi:putative ATPase [Paenibacillus brasilensis]|uniref:ATPase n=1 Tax=Paenibacillus brasilensis TaxID=128574 RepID=A0ABU0KYP8_9BACL|nr:MULTISPECIES: hypothetical protein [Paenibacillus]MDQ0494568.1 putative ATPase [Paenibacillus brasilensis]
MRGDLIRRVALYHLTHEGIETRTLEETDHFIIMKQFLNNKEKMLHELFDDPQ